MTVLLTFYGDDFTGSTDAMETLARAGIRTVLFVDALNPAELSDFRAVGAIGVAGATRAMVPNDIETVLARSLTQLRDLGAPVTHYKVCSTFDSSPTLGSIGRAIEVGTDVFSSAYVPVVLGTPRLGRYTAFGHLFARESLGGPSAGGHVYRLDRHPTMKRHPVTPMPESDLRVHLANQTDLPIGLLDVSEIGLPEPEPDVTLRSLVASGSRVVFIDVLAEEHSAAAGRLIWQGADEGARFVVGSSGVESALVEHWRRSGIIDRAGSLPAARAVERCIAVSGSASPVNDRQIAYALEHGWQELALDLENLDDELPVGEAVRALRGGANVMLHTARGPDDPRLQHGLRPASELGDTLGRLLKAILAEAKVERVIVAGGDTSAYVVRRLGVRALEAIAAGVPGSPVCRIHAPGEQFANVELVLKGGQVGPVTYYVDIESTVGQPQNGR